MPEPRDCAVCGRPLSYMEGSGWLHANPADDPHIAVPVQKGAVLTVVRCDFCNHDTAEGLVLPVESFVSNETGQGSVGDWAVCRGCEPFVSANDWLGLTIRILETAGYPSWMRPAMLPRLQAFYAELEQHITGPIA